MTKIEQAIAGIIAAIEDGRYQPSMKARMDELERQKAEITARMAEAPVDMPDVHPNVATNYSRNVARFGGNVRKGERGTTVVYADRFTPEGEKRRVRETGEEPGKIPFLKRFTVFNAAQCEGLPEEIATVAHPPPPGLIEPQVEALIRATGIDFRIGGNRAFYVPSQDFMMVPPPQAYHEPINWHRTALHEMGHATGHATRLNRDFSGSFGTKKYAFEELIVEITAAFCCASLGIVPTVRHADYIGSWLEVLREDNRQAFLRDIVDNVESVEAPPVHKPDVWFRMVVWPPRAKIRPRGMRPA